MQPLPATALLNGDGLSAILDLKLPALLPIESSGVPLLMQFAHLSEIFYPPGLVSSGAWMGGRLGGGLQAGAGNTGRFDRGEGECLGEATRARRKRHLGDEWSGGLLELCLDAARAF